MPKISESRSSVRLVFDVVTSLTLVLAALFLVYRSLDSDRPRVSLSPPEDPVSLHGAVLRGSEDAQHVMVVFSDFQCPFCGRFAREALPEIERRYVSAGRVQLAFRHLPLANHPHAFSAAVSSECAREQGRFWQMHDQLFAAESLEGTNQTQIARDLGLNMQEFEVCTGRGEAAKIVKDSVENATSLGARVTPSFFLGARREDGGITVVRAFSGALPADEIASHIDDVIGGRGGWRRWLNW